MASAENPFGDLHPVFRNEEDEIRKGIFSFALRKLHALPLEEKQRWCDAIVESTSKKQKPARKVERPQTEKAGIEMGKDGQASDAPSPIEARQPTTASTGEEGSGAALRLEIKDEAPPFSVGEKRPRAACESSADAHIAREGHALDDGKRGAEALTDEKASEFIGSYMRALLDRVVGGSLADLSASSLRVLCLMVGIPTTAKSKDTLYNVLASFHFTNCERLGKRVSKETFRQEDFRQTAAMLSRLAPKRPLAAGGARRLTSAASPAGGSTGEGRGRGGGEGSEGPNANGGEAEKKAGGDDGAAARRDRAPACEADGLAIAFPGLPFARTRTGTAGAEGGGEGPTGWAPAEFERRVASIVQLCDPVTVAIVVRKLAQMGYRAADAAEAVEATLRRFHQRQFIFYDNGIAYMM